MSYDQLLCWLAARLLDLAASLAFYLADPDSERFRVKQIAAGAVELSLPALGDHDDDAEVVEASDLLDPLRFSLLQTPVSRSRAIFADGAQIMLLVDRRLPHEYGLVNLYRMDSATGRVIGRMDSIGNRALFIGTWCLVVDDADRFPSINANCIYYRTTQEDARGDISIYVYDLAHGTHDKIDPDVSAPYMLVQLLSNYTMHVPWYQPAWDELLGKFELSF
ncbi:hypothetical protein QOZ80_1AG0047160 [Eleusine coracana subsp. coracana]|nr:hypothetical protein QOZ80_1AG0047160 [Eleusine coracana subsp. coracana]